MKTIFETYVDAGDAVVMQDPSWRMYEVYNNIYQGRALLVPYDGKLGFNAGAVLRAVRESSIRLVILANPNQPTGTLMDDADVEAIIAEGAKTGTIVVMDEAYHLFTPKTALGWVTRYPNLIVVRTFSKAFGLAGLRLGYCVSQAERISELSLLRPVTDSNSIALKCGEYALDHMDWIEDAGCQLHCGPGIPLSCHGRRGARNLSLACKFPAGSMPVSRGGDGADCGGSTAQVPAQGAVDRGASAKLRSREHRSARADAEVLVRMRRHREATCRTAGLMT